MKGSRKQVMLEAYENPGVRHRLEAKIDEKGNLVLEGYDIGSFVEEHWGDSDYEWWITIKSEDKDRVLLLLLQQVFGDKGKRFSSDAGFREWLKANGVESEFFSYP